MDERLRSAHGKVWAYLFLGALAVRLLYLSQYATSAFFWVPTLDTLYHDLLARGIAAGHPERQAFFRAPLYYYCLGAVYWLFGHSFWAARILQALVGSLSCVLLYEIGQRLFRPTVGLLAAGAMALYGPLVFFDGELHTPVLEVFLDLCFVLLALRANEAGSPRLWLAAGAVLGLSAITRPNALVAAPLIIVWIWGARRTEARVSACTTAAVLFLLGAVAAPGLVTLRNERIGGDRVFIASQGGINLFLGNRPGADGFTPSTPRRYRFLGEYEDSVALYGQRAAEEAVGRRLRASEAQSYWVGRAARWWREQPKDAWKLTWKKWVLLWTHREIRNNVAFDFIRAEIAPFLWLCPLGFWLAGPLGLLGMALAWRQNARARFLAAFVLLYGSSFVAFFIADRYRLPIVPLLLLFGAYALVWGVERFRARNWRVLCPAAVALAGLAVFVNVDWYATVTPATRALDTWSAGNRCKDLGRVEEAEVWYRKALALDARNAEVWTNLGAVQFAAGRPADAARSFARVLLLRPDDSSGYYNLAMCELRLGHPEYARRCLQRAIRVDPEDQAARAELARMEKAE